MSFQKSTTSISNTKPWKSYVNSSLQLWKRLLSQNLKRSKRVTFTMDQYKFANVCTDNMLVWFGCTILLKVFCISLTSVFQRRPIENRLWYDSFQYLCQRLFHWKSFHKRLTWYLVSFEFTILSKWSKSILKAFVIYHLPTRSAIFEWKFLNIFIMNTDIDDTFLI